MIKCAVCNEQVHGDHDLCYLHRKYEDGLCGPHYETLWELMWAKLHFLKDWTMRIGTKIRISMDAFVETAKMNTNTVEKCRSAIQEYIDEPNVDMNQYVKHLSNLASSLAASYPIDRDDAFQLGAECLMVLSKKAKPQHSPKMVHTWILHSLRGMMMNKVLRQVSPSTEDTMGYNEDTDLPDTTCTYDAYHRMNQELVLDMNMEKLREGLSPKQLEVMENMFQANPLTQRELGKKMGISQQAVAKLTRKVFKKAKAIGRYYVRDL